MKTIFSFLVGLLCTYQLNAEYGSPIYVINEEDAMKLRGFKTRVIFLSCASPVKALFFHILANIHHNLTIYRCYTKHQIVICCRTGVHVITMAVRASQCSRI